ADIFPFSRVKDGDDRGVLSKSEFEHNSAVFFEVFSAVRDYMADHSKPVVRAVGKRGARFEFANVRFELCNVTDGNVRRIRHDQIELLLCNTGKYIRQNKAQTAFDRVAFRVRGCGLQGGFGNITRNARHVLNIVQNRNADAPRTDAYLQKPSRGPAF